MVEKGREILFSMRDFNGALSTWEEGGISGSHTVPWVMGLGLRAGAGAEHAWSFDSNTYFSSNAVPHSSVCETRPPTSSPLAKHTVLCVPLISRTAWP